MSQKEKEAQNSQPFEYSPLGTREIRLLELLPSPHFNSDIHCKVFSSSLESHPPYEALSYVWGDSKFTTSIQAQRRPHQVTTNLELALRYLRLPTERRVLWVDAVCINQQDILEKNEQVTQMRRIYLGAEKVVVWLGEEEDAAIALKFCNMIQNGVSMSRFEREVESHGLTLDEVWSLCHALFTRPWWTRTWILQEVIHSKPATVYIGTIQLDLDELCAKYNGYQTYKHTHSAMQSDSKEHFDIYSGVFQIEAMINIVEIIGWRREQLITSQDEEPIIGMLSALHMSRFQQCKDPRDKIYGLCGLISDIDLSIDYSLSRSELYTATMVKMLLRYPESLLFVQSPDRRIGFEELPSWVPDWATSRSLVPSIMSFWLNEVFSCSGDSMDNENKSLDLNLKSAFHIDCSTLVIQAIPVGTITKTCFFDVIFGIGKEWQDTVKLFTYEKNYAGMQNISGQKTLHDGTKGPMSPTMTMSNSSWGPYWAESGDIIIISRLCWAPLVLRRDGTEFLFVGGCCLVDSELRGSGPGHMSDIEALSKDPGFSPIMHGSAWDEDKLETFRIK